MRAASVGTSSSQADNIVQTKSNLWEKQDFLIPPLVITATFIVR